MFPPGSHIKYLLWEAAETLGCRGQLTLLITKGMPLRVKTCPHPYFFTLASCLLQGKESSGGGKKKKKKTPRNMVFCPSQPTTSHPLRQ